jgi:hypothetical protein
MSDTPVTAKEPVTPKETQVEPTVTPSSPPTVVPESNSPQESYREKVLRYAREYKEYTEETAKKEEEQHKKEKANQTKVLQLLFDQLKTLKGVIVHSSIALDPKLDLVAARIDTQAGTFAVKGSEMLYVKHNGKSRTHPIQFTMDTPFDIQEKKNTYLVTELLEYYANDIQSIVRLPK